MKNPYADLDDPAPSAPVNPYAELDTAKTSATRRIVGDTAISALKGAIGLPESIVGLANIPTLGYAGKAVEAAGIRFKDAKTALDELYSPEQKLANMRVSEAQGVADTIKEVVTNPSVAFHTTVESLPSMIGGAGLARGGAKALGVLAPKVAPLISAPVWGGIGEGAISAGQSAEQIRQESADGTITAGQAGAALASGAGTAAIGVVGGSLAQKWKLADPETVLYGGRQMLPAGTKPLGAIARMTGGALSEGMLQELPQSLQEQVWQNVATGRPWNEGLAQAGVLGAAAGGLLGGVANIGRAPVAPAVAPPAAPAGPTAGEKGQGGAPISPVDPGAPPAPPGSLTAAAQVATGNEPAIPGFATEEAAGKRAAAEAARTGQPYGVLPHPDQPAQFAAAPQADIDAIEQPEPVPVNPHQARIDEATVELTDAQDHLLKLQTDQAAGPNPVREMRIEVLKKQVADLNKSISNLTKLGEASAAKVQPQTATSAVGVTNQPGSEPQGAKAVTGEPQAVTPTTAPAAESRTLSAPAADLMSAPTYEPTPAAETLHEPPAKFSRLTDPAQRQAAIAEINQLKLEAKALGAKGGLTAQEGARYDQVMTQIQALRFDLGRPDTEADITAPEQERMSTLSPKTNAAISADMFRNKDIYTAIGSAAAGAAYNADTAVDRIFDGKNPAVTPQEAYDTFAASREALRAQYGDTLTLYRAPGEQKTKTTTNWATTREFAQQFGEKVISKQIPVEDVLAAHVSGKGRYHELIIGDSSKFVAKPAAPEIVALAQSRGKAWDALPPMARTLADKAIASDDRLTADNIQYGKGGTEMSTSEASFAQKRARLAATARAMNAFAKAAAPHLPADTDANSLLNWRRRSGAYGADTTPAMRQYWAERDNQEKSNAGREDEKQRNAAARGRGEAQGEAARAVAESVRDRAPDQRRAEERAAPERRPQRQAAAEVEASTQPVTFSVIEAGTGREVTVTMPANKALAKIDSRIQMMKDLLTCLSS
jgi:hypothetical protein